MVVPATRRSLAKCYFSFYSLGYLADGFEEGHRPTRSETPRPWRDAPASRDRRRMSPDKKLAWSGGPTTPHALSLVLRASFRRLFSGTASGLFPLFAFVFVHIPRCRSSRRVWPRLYPTLKHPACPPRGESHGRNFLFVANAVRRHQGGSAWRPSPDDPWRNAPGVAGCHGSEGEAVLAFLAAEPREPAIQGLAVQAQDLRGLGLVLADGLQDPQDVPALDLLQGD